MTKFVTAVVLALALLAPTSASAAKAPKPVRDCTADGRIDGRYSKSELRRAIKAVPKSSKGKECKKRLNRVLKRGGDGRLKSSGSYKHKMKKKGSYRIICSIHAGMDMKLKVK